MLSAFVLIDADTERPGDLPSELADVDGLAEVYSVAGECDLTSLWDLGAE